ncbi:hypothetical protein [Neisseria bergeri]|nr:hypothetical protein [Neisseria bergeri]
MTIWKLPETQKQLKPNTLDSRLRGKDGGRMPSETSSFLQLFVIPVKTGI